MEAGALVLLTGLPIIGTSMGVTAKIITLCFTALPLGIFGLIGVDGMSLSTFVYGFIKFLRNRRVLRNRAVLGQLDAVLPDRKRRQSKKLGDGSIESFLPIERIENGIVCTKDGRFLKILELEPINFLLRSAREQRGIIYSFVSYLKVSPVKLQFKALTRKADINRHLESIRREIATETDENCRRLQEDYLNLVRKLGSREAVTRRFFLVFEYETSSSRKPEERDINSHKI